MGIFLTVLLILVNFPVSSFSVGLKILNVGVFVSLVFYARVVLGFKQLGFKSAVNNASVRPGDVLFCVFDCINVLFTIFQNNPVRIKQVENYLSFFLFVDHSTVFVSVNVELDSHDFSDVSNVARGNVVAEDFLRFEEFLDSF